MIKSLELRNFQKHSQKILEFNEGINVIVGPSNAGKTALLRALYWIIENRPQGVKKILRHGAKEMSVTIETDNNTITRARGVKNTYTINGQLLEAVGTKVPTEVAQATSNISIQKQHDSLFLIELESGAQSHFLNKLLKLDFMDSLQMKIDGAKRKANAELKLIKVGELKKQLAQLDWVEKARKLLDEINIEIKEPEHIGQYQKCLKVLEIQDIIEQLETVLNKLENIKEPRNIEKYKEMKVTLVNATRQMPQVCPTCGASISYLPTIL